MSTAQVFSLPSAFSTVFPSTQRTRGLSLPLSNNSQAVLIQDRLRRLLLAIERQDEEYFRACSASQGTRGVIDCRLINQINPDAYNSLLLVARNVDQIVPTALLRPRAREILRRETVLSLASEEIRKGGSTNIQALHRIQAFEKLSQEDLLVLYFLAKEHSTEVEELFLSWFPTLSKASKRQTDLFLALSAVNKEYLAGFALPNTEEGNIDRFLIDQLDEEQYLSLLYLSREEDRVISEALSRPRAKGSITQEVTMTLAADAIQSGSLERVSTLYALEGLFSLTTKQVLTLYALAEEKGQKEIRANLLKWFPFLSLSWRLKGLLKAIDQGDASYFEGFAIPNTCQGDFDRRLIWQVGKDTYNSLVIQARNHDQIINSALDHPLLQTSLNKKTAYLLAFEAVEKGNFHRMEKLLEKGALSRLSLEQFLELYFLAKKNNQRKIEALMFERGDPKIQLAQTRLNQLYWAINHQHTGYLNQFAIANCLEGEIDYLLIRHLNPSAYNAFILFSGTKDPLIDIALFRSDVGEVLHRDALLALVRSYLERGSLERLTLLCERGVLSKLNAARVLKIYPLIDNGSPEIKEKFLTWFPYLKSKERLSALLNAIKQDDGEFLNGFADLNTEKGSSDIELINQLDQETYNFFIMEMRENGRMVDIALATPNAKDALYRETALTLFIDAVHRKDLSRLKFLEEKGVAQRLSLGEIYSAYKLAKELGGREEIVSWLKGKCHCLPIRGKSKISRVFQTQETVLESTAEESSPIDIPKEKEAALKKAKELFQEAEKLKIHARELEKSLNEMPNFLIEAAKLRKEAEALKKAANQEVEVELEPAKSRKELLQEASSLSKAAKSLENAVEPLVTREEMVGWLKAAVRYLEEARGGKKRPDIAEKTAYLTKAVRALEKAISLKKRSHLLKRAAKDIEIGADKRLAGQDFSSEEVQRKLIRVL